MSNDINKALVFGIRGLIVLILIVPLVVTQHTLFPYVVGKALFLRICIELAFGLWVVLALRDNRYLLPKTWIIPLFLLYLLVNLISAILGVSFQRSFWGDVRRMGGAFDMAHWFLFLVVVVSMWRTTRQWRWLFNANLAVSLVVSIIGIVLDHYRIHLFGSFFSYVYQTASDRVQGTFGNADYVGAYAVVNILLAFAFLADSFAPKTPKVEPEPAGRAQRRSAPRSTQDDWAWLWRGFWAVTLLANFWVLTLSGTRGALAGLAGAFLVAGVVYAIVGVHKRLRIVAASLSGLMLASVLLVPLAHDAGLMKGFAGANPLFRRIDDTLSGGLSSAYESRRVIVAGGLAAFHQHPLFGWGPENFQVAFDRYGDPAFGEQIADQAHDKPVEVLTNTGIIGLAFYVAIVFTGIWVIYRKLRRDPQEQLLTLFLGAAFVGYVLQDLFLFDTPSTYLQYMLLLAWVISLEVVGQPSPAPAAAPQVASTRRARRAAAAAASQEQEKNAGQPSWLTSLSSPPVRNTVSVLVVGLVLFSVYWTDIRAYKMAADFPVQGKTLTQFVQDAKGSFAEFPPLATLPRLFLMDTLTANWQTGGGTLAILKDADTEGRKALANEPQNARLYISLANLLQTAAPKSADVLNESQALLEKAKQLGPSLPTYLAAEKKQQSLQQQLATSGTAPAVP